MKIIVFSKWFQGINEISYQKKWLPRLNAQVCVSSAFYQHNLGFECYGDINEKTEAKGVGGVGGWGGGWRVLLSPDLELHI